MLVVCIDIEECFEIPTAPGYEISRSGRVYRLPYIKRGKNSYGSLSYLKSRKEVAVSMGAEYPQLEVHLNGRRKTVKLHRLLAETFIPNPDKLQQVNHKDGNKFNFSLDNLEWTSPSDNVKHSYEKGLASNLGSRHPRSKLNEGLVLEIKSLMKFYNQSNRDLGKAFGVHHSTISKIRRGKLWSHVNL